MLSKLLQGNIISENGFVICENGGDDIFGGNKELMEKFVVYKQNRYSISYITILKLKEEQ